MKELVEAFPESQFRPLVKVWLMAMTGEEIADQPPELEPGILFEDDSDLVNRQDAPETPESPTVSAANAKPASSNPTATEESPTEPPQEQPPRK